MTDDFWRGSAWKYREGARRNLMDTWDSLHQQRWVITAAVRAVSLIQDQDKVWFVYELADSLFNCKQD